MDKFLKVICKDISEDSGRDYSKVSIVFPSRRAGMYFRRELQKMLDKPVISPSIYSINDFVFKFSGLRSENKLRLIFRLYKAQLTEGIQEDFDKFYDWGRILLNDFNEIDKALINTDKIFKVVTDFKNLEANLELDVERDYYLFWKRYSQSDDETKNQFQQIWEKLPVIYKTFTEELFKDKLAYDGLAYRILDKAISKNEINFHQNKINFAGFNYLSQSEENIIYNTITATDGKLYLDTDEFYLKDSNKEAGVFINSNIKNFRKRLEKDKREFDKYIRVISDNSIDRSGKIINIIGAPLSSGSAKVLGEELSKAKIENESEVAIILPDENMLLPVMNSLPAKIEHYNVTMGFPLRDTPVYSLVYIIRDLQSNIKDGKFYFEDVLKVLLHPYVRFENIYEVHSIIRRIKLRNLIYLSKEDIIGDAWNLFIASEIFVICDSTEKIFKYLKGIVKIIYGRLSRDEKNSTLKFQLEYIFGFYTQLKVLMDSIEEYKIVVNVNIFWNILMEMLRTLSIPLTGEPISGVQVMGLLETRTLDFENVFIMSANEGALPRIDMTGSYIPYQIRKYFRMPTFEDDSSIQAYNFFRAIQGAENVYILYDSMMSDSSKGKSRYILQLENEIAKSEIREKSYTIPVTPYKEDEIKISKTAEILNRIKKLSPSDISVYLNCSLQFYYQKILNLYEENTVDEEYDAALFGNLVHKVMQNLYTPYLNKELTKEKLEDIKTEVKNNFDKIFSNAALAISQDIKKRSKNKIEMTIDVGTTGQNLASIEIIKELVLKILERDLNYVPFNIIGLEEEIIIPDYKFEDENETKRKIEIKGKLDRIEIKDNGTNIIDYKTGSFKFKSSKSNMEDIKTIAADSKFKDFFQAGFYLFLYNQSKQENANAGMFYVVKETDIKWVFDDTWDDKPKFLELYKEFVDEILKEIFSLNNYFEKTADKDHCRYCPMISLCYREN